MRTPGAPYRENAKLYPAVIACDKREAFAWERSDEAIRSFFVPRGGLLRLARNDADRPQHLDTPRSWDMTYPSASRKILSTGSTIGVSATSVTPM